MDELPPPSAANAEPGEVLQVAWLPLTESAIRARPWAFEHDRLLLDLAAFLAREFAEGRADTHSLRRYQRAQIEARYPFTER